MTTDAADAFDQSNQRAAALQARGRSAEAAELFRAAQKLRPDDPLPFLNAAVCLIAAGDAKAALAEASGACWRAPAMPEAHYAYGQAFAALGENANAEQAFAHALQLQPHWADAWINYGLALYRLGRIEDAKTAMRQALAADPGNAAAASNLAAFLRISGQAEESERLLEARLQRDRADYAARLNRVAELLQEERAGAALELLQEIAPPEDRALARPWRLAEALAWLQLRRAAEARAALDAVAALGPIPPPLQPLWRWRRLLLARLEGDAAQVRAEAEAMESALGEMGPEATPEHAIMAHFDLAKFWSMHDENARAMAHWREGHRLLARFQPFSRAAHRAFVDASIASFTPERLAQGPRAANEDAAPVFVVGMPRSGTTLVEQIVSTHRDVHGAGERVALARAFYALGDAPERIVALSAPALDRVAASYLAQLHALAPDKSRIVDKMPGNFLHLGLAALMLPQAKYIHCRRDPRDIGLSIFTFRFHGAHSYAHDLADLGWYIGEHERLMAHWKAALPGRVLEVKLSDWVEDFDATLARVLAHLDLPPDANCARFYQQDSRVRTVSRTQVREPINARGLGRWRAFAPALEPLIAELEKAGALARWT